MVRSSRTVISIKLFSVKETHATKIGRVDEELPILPCISTCSTTHNSTAIHAHVDIMYGKSPKYYHFSKNLPFVANFHCPRNVGIATMFYKPETRTLFISFVYLHRRFVAVNLVFYCNNAVLRATIFYNVLKSYHAYSYS